MWFNTKFRYTSNLAETKALNLTGKQKRNYVSNRVRLATKKRKKNVKKKTKKKKLCNCILYIICVSKTHIILPKGDNNIHVKMSPLSKYTLWHCPSSTTVISSGIPSLLACKFFKIHVAKSSLISHSNTNRLERKQT